VTANTATIMNLIFHLFPSARVNITRPWTTDFLLARTVPSGWTVFTLSEDKKMGDFTQ
jgi:hypothetical protein